MGSAGATFDFPEGLFQWAGAGIDLYGNTLTNAGFMTLTNTGAGLYGNNYFTGGSTLDLAGSLINNGTIVQQGAFGFDFCDNITLDNTTTGTYEFAGDGSIVRSNLSPSFVNAGTIEKTAGTGTTTIAVAFANTGNISVLSGTLVVPNGSLDLTGSSYIASAPGATIAVSGNLLGNTQDVDLFNPQGTVLLNGSGTSSSPQQLEVMSQDLGNVAAGFTNNFDYGTLQVGSGDYVRLVDQSKNSSGSGAEALYVGTLIVPAGATLDLNGLDVYARIVGAAGIILNGHVNQTPPGGALAIDTPTAGFINATYPSNGWTFFGRANQAVSVIVNPGDPSNPPNPVAPTLGYAQVQILDANGNVVATGTSTTSGGDVDLLGVILQTDGTYQVVIAPPSSHASSTGNYTIGVYDATVSNNALSLSQNVIGQLYTGYEIDHWTFTAQANDQVQFNLVNESEFRHSV